jgi:hypothetical protein
MFWEPDFEEPDAIPTKIRDYRSWALTKVMMIFEQLSGDALVFSRQPKES